MFAAAVGVYGFRTHPFVPEEVFLSVIEARRPDILRGLAYTYALVWFATPFCVASLATSLFAIVASRYASAARFRPLPPYPEPESRLTIP